MRKFVVISVNENPEYIFYIPLVTWAWKKLGWIPIVQIVNTIRTPLIIKDEITMNFNQQAGYRSETVAQMARLYAACGNFEMNDYIMTSDVDMLPLSDYWKFDPDKITVWGHDLTGYQHMPICYIGMKVSRWIEVMGLTSTNYNHMLQRDLDSMPNAKSEDQVKRWVVDQDLITERINAVQFEKEFIHRGVYENGYPIGRVDRSAWTLKHDTFIDCHMPRVLNASMEKAKLLNLILKVWPEEDFRWFDKYSEQFSSLIK